MKTFQTENNVKLQNENVFQFEKKKLLNSKMQTFSILKKCQSLVKIFFKMEMISTPKWKRFKKKKRFLCDFFCLFYECILFKFIYLDNFTSPIKTSFLLGLLSVVTSFHAHHKQFEIEQSCAYQLKTKHLRKL